jgi:hypothetical protein
MATSQRLNAFSNDLDCMVEVKCVGLNCFVDGAVCIELSKPLLAPSPIAVLAANSHLPAPKITTSVGNSGYVTK